MSEELKHQAPHLQLSVSSCAVSHSYAEVMEIIKRTQAPIEPSITLMLNGHLVVVCM